MSMQVNPITPSIKPTDALQSIISLQVIDYITQTEIFAYRAFKRLILNSTQRLPMQLKIFSKNSCMIGFDILYLH
jgi:hypothetical protein